MIYFLVRRFIIFLTKKCQVQYPRFTQAHTHTYVYIYKYMISEVEDVIGLRNRLVLL